MEELKELEEKITHLSNYYYRRKGQEQQLQKELQKVTQELEKVVQEQELWHQVRLLFQEAAAYAREQARQQVEYMVTQALQYIFGPEIEFRINLAEIRKRPEAEFLVASQYEEGIEVVTKPQDARGGGVVDIISLALRLALLQCYRPELKGPLILDEPAKHVSENYSAQVADFLKQVSDLFGRQVILVTHNRQLAHSGDRAFQVEMKGSQSQVFELG